MKRRKLVRGGLFTFLFILSIAFCIAEEHYSIVEKNHKKGLANKRGEIIIPTEYDDLGWSSGTTEVVKDIIGYKKNGHWGMLNLKNQKVSEASFKSLYPYNENTLVASRTYYGAAREKYGLIDTKGNNITEFIYDDLDIYDNRIVVGQQNRNIMKYGLIDEKGSTSVSLKYDDIKVINKFLYAVSGDMKSYAFINESGRPINNQSYDSLQSLYYGYSEVYKDGRSGLIDSGGELVLPTKYKSIEVDTEGTIKAMPFPKWKLLDNRNNLRAVFYYDEVSPFRKNVFKASINQAEGLININDEMISGVGRIKILDLQDSLIAYKKDDKYGVLTLSGIEILPAKYDAVKLDLPSILIKTRENGATGWYVYDYLKEKQLSAQYDEIVRLNASLFKVKSGKYWGLISHEGDEILIPKYESIGQPFEGRLKVDFYGEDGILDENGEWVILPDQATIELLPGNKYLRSTPYGSAVISFEGDTIFETEYLLFKHGDLFLEKGRKLKQGLIDTLGNRLTQSIYDSISDIQQDSIFFAFRDDETSFVTKSGAILNRLDQRFEEVGQMAEDFIGVKIDGKYGYVDPNGDLRVANQYQDVGVFSQGLGAVKVIGNWGFVNKIEQFIVQPRYDTVYTFINDLCIVVDDGKYGLVDTEGKLVIRPEYDHLNRLSNNAFISELNGKKGLVDKYGKPLILPRFHSIDDLNNGWVIVSRNEKYGLMSLTGLSIIPMMYDDMKYDKYNDLYLVKEAAEWEEIELSPN